MRLTLIAGLLALAPLTAHAAGDPDAGKSVYSGKCRICHSNTAGENRVGPSLAGVVGRKSGMYPGFNYSDAMKAANKTWDEATLNVYLTHPKEVVPGTKMAFNGIADDTDRANLIAYLTTLK